MVKTHFTALIKCVCLGLAIGACSPARHLSEGEYRLAGNEVSIAGESQLKTSDISPYIKQQPASFKLFGSDLVVYNPELVDASIENIRTHLEYLGYYHSDIQSNVSVNKRNVKVAYDIIPGDRYQIDTIVFETPHRGDFAKDFMEDLPNLSIHRGDYLSESALEAESIRSSAEMRKKGYFGFSKNYYFFEADTLRGRDSVLLAMKVKEYTRNESESAAEPLTRFYLGNITVSHDSKLRFNDKVLKRLTTIRPGDLYDETAINNTYSRLTSLKLFNSIGIELSKADTNIVDCNINLTQSRLQGFKVNLEASTNSSGLMGISPQLSYYHKNIFHGGEWLNLSFMGNFQFKTNDDTRANELGTSASISFPRFLGLGYKHFTGATLPRTEISASYSHQDRPEYNRTIGSMAFGYTGTTPGRLSYQFFPLQVNLVNLSNIDPVFNNNLSKNPFMAYAYQDHLDAGAGGMIYYTSSAEAIPHTSYHYIRYSMDVSGNLINLLSSTPNVFGIPFSQYLRSELTLGKTFKFGKEDKHAIASRFIAGAGYAYGNASVLPFEKQFYAGGANSMRGWQSRSVGPGASPLNESFIIPSQTGDLKFEANLEYRFPLVWKLDGALFGDAGNVWTLKQDRSNDPDAAITTFRFDTIAADWGFGVRCDLNFLVVRIDTGFKVHDPSRPAGERWLLTPNYWFKRNGFAVHFGVGYPF